MVAAIEKYLVHRGYSVPMSGSTPDDEINRANVALIEEDSDDEIDDTYEQTPISSTSNHVWSTSLNFNWSSVQHLLVLVEQQKYAVLSTIILLHNHIVSNFTSTDICYKVL